MIGAFAAIFDESGRLLVVQERKVSRRFGLPGGRIEAGETAEAAVVRECREETGLVVRIDYRIGSYELTNGLTALVFRCSVHDNSAQASSVEGDAYVGWHSPSDLPHPLRNSLHYALPDILGGRRNVVRSGLAPIAEA